MAKFKKFLLLALLFVVFNVHCQSYMPGGESFLESESPLRTARAQTTLDQLRAVNDMPAARMAAWAINVHPVIAAVFAEQTYSTELRMLVSQASWLIEQRTRSFFESHLDENQGRVRDILAPRLLEKHGDLLEQAKILMWMVDMHPVKAADNNSESLES
jgi:hypothetical protein